MTRDRGAVAYAPVRWGVGDFFWVFLAQILGVIVAAVIWAAPGVSGLSDDEAGAYLVFPAQYAGMVVALLLVVRKGRGSLRADFGFRVSARDWVALLIGVACVFALGFVAWPFDLLLDTDEPAQEILRTLEESQSVAIVVALGFGAIVLAPIVEEIVFRGLLLRALLRRVQPWAAVTISGVVFGLVHLPGASGLAAVATVTALSGFGIILGFQAYRHGSLSRPILTHMGFNALGFLVTVLA